LVKMCLHPRRDGAQGGARAGALLVDLGLLFGGDGHGQGPWLVWPYLVAAMRAAINRRCGMAGATDRPALRSGRRHASLAATNGKGMTMTIRYLHTMVRVLDLEKTMAFFR